MVDDAEKMYVELCGKSLSPDVNTYRTLIDAYLKLGRIDEAMDKYTKMVEAGLRVIPTYANKWFSELIENGKIVECVPILTKMGEKDPKPDATTYDIVIRAVSNYDTSLSLLQQMVSYGPVLKEHVLDVFDKVGRRDDIDRLLNARWSAQRHGGANPNGSGSHYGNWQRNGGDQQVVNGEQGYEQPQTGSVAL
ncbi:putative tetratricopeptide-like helical domain superfamily [Helianthus annuus]|nr:putative tetratricopeptide-like helical domain superfamily [Helianthus annuus]KAJ0553975.1 putative tetratricopeptide-like helical domain superfamily [Helianthus annuus]KAJ0898384.1 putative tetratricopeptide-like helical domain superfamily [Helianthus annuus]